MIRAALVLLVFIAPAWAQAPSAAKSAATSVNDAHDLRGIWQAKGNAYRNLEAEKGGIMYPTNSKITYRTEPCQIFKQEYRLLIVYQHVHAYRVIFTDGRPHYDDGIEFYMGDSRGHWDGNTLVVDATNFKAENWLDAAGHFLSNKLHVVERYTRTAPNTMSYEATLEDSEVFQRAWTIRVALALHTEPNFQLIEHECDRDAQGVYRHPPQFLK